MIRKFATTSTIALLVWPLVARASEGAEALPSSDIVVLGTVSDGLTTPSTAGSRLGLTALETAASVEVLSGDVIRERGDRSIADAVTRATGISTVASPGDGGTGLSARGFSGQGSVMQLYDGVRLYPGAGTITFPTDPWMVERIEVLRGAASVLYGQGAIGGAVNVISKKPNFDRMEVEAEAGFGSQDSWRIGAGVGGPVNDAVAYRFDVSRIGSDGWVDRGGSKGMALSGSLQFRPTETLTITVSDDYSDQHPMKYFGTPLIGGRLGDNRERNYNVADAAMHFRDNRTTAKVEWTPNDNVSVRNTAYRLTSVRDWLNLESYAWNGATGLIDRGDFIGIRHRQTQVGNQGDVTIRSEVGGVGNQLLVGFDVNSIKFAHDNDFDSDAAPAGSGEAVDPYRFSPGLYYTTFGVRPQYRTKTRQFSVFAEDRLKFGERFSVTAGINFDHANVKRFVNAYDGAGVATETQRLDKTLRNTTWRVGAVYQPVPTVSIYGQYATAVDPLGSLVTYSVGQAAFRNATGDQVEFGAKYSFLEGQGSATVAAYRIVKKNLLATVPGTVPPVIEQVGQRSSKGIEASVAVDLAGGFGIDANGAVLKAQFDDFLSGTISYAGKVPPNVPEATANLWLRYAVTKRLRTRAGLRYVGRSFSDNANRFRVAGYAVVDAGISYALTDNVAVNGRIYNLLDKDYATTTYNDQQWLLGRPRSFVRRSAYVFRRL